MKKQIIQVLWGIAKGQPQVQGETVVYPNIREQLNAIKALMSIEGWEEEQVPTQQSSPAERPTTPIEHPTTSVEHPTTSVERPTTPAERPAASVEHPIVATQSRPIQPRQRPARKKQLFIRGTSIPIG
ncbi:hypothetical protein [Capnocytophaga granulosa]|uniref:hypothetical protein n=1 Tax=Capnocytophaga granulosa TaxID=45242 RepID=UPI0028E9CF8D|nr:hypothetical protein [Capnocytophaga granulosa]